VEIEANRKGVTNNHGMAWLTRDALDKAIDNMAVPQSEIRGEVWRTAAKPAADFGPRAFVLGRGG
jgi:hypothetical protein